MGSRCRLRQAGAAARGAGRGRVPGGLRTRRRPHRGAGRRPGGRLSLVPSNQAATSAAAVVSDPGGFDHVFYRGQTTGVFVRTYDGASWSAQTDLGGLIIGAPAAARAGTTLAVAGRGLDSALWVRLRTGGVGRLVQPGRRADVGPGRGRASRRHDRGVRAGDRRPALDAHEGAERQPVRVDALDGWLTTAPAAVVVGAGRLDVYVTGGDRGVWRRSRSTAGWGWWGAPGRDHLLSPGGRREPAGHRRAGVRARHERRAVRQRRRRGSWSGWQSRGGLLIDVRPAAAGRSGCADVVGRGIDNAAG